MELDKAGRILFAERFQLRFIKNSARLIRVSNPGQSPISGNRSLEMCCGFHPFFPPRTRIEGKRNGGGEVGLTRRGNERVAF